MTGNFFADIILLGIAAAILGLWWTGSRAKELAVSHARSLCARESVQLLDYTVELQKISLSQSAAGSKCLRREFRFEFTAEGSYRDQGTVSLNGHSLANVHLPYTRDEEGNRVFIH